MIENGQDTRKSITVRCVCVCIAHMPMLTPDHHHKCLQWEREHHNWTMKYWMKMAQSDHKDHWVICLWKRWHQDALGKEDILAEAV